MPAACAAWCGSDRGYTVPASNAVLAHRWSTCEAVSLSGGDRDGPGAGPRLHPDEPDPFASSTVISYELASPSRVGLSVYNVLGQEVRTLGDAERAPGPFRVPFLVDGLPAGAYIYRVETAHGVLTRTLVIGR